MCFNIAACTIFKAQKSFLFAPALRHWQVVRCSSLIHPCIGQIQGIFWLLGKVDAFRKEFKEIFHIFFDVRSGGGFAILCPFQQELFYCILQQNCSKFGFQIRVKRAETLLSLSWE